LAASSGAASAFFAALRLLVTTASLDKAPCDVLWETCKNQVKGFLAIRDHRVTTLILIDIYGDQINLDSTRKRAIMGLDGNFGNLGRNLNHALPDLRVTSLVKQLGTQ
jgi:hypothetical protein